MSSLEKRLKEIKSKSNDPHVAHAVQLCINEVRVAHSKQNTRTCALIGQLRNGVTEGMEPKGLVAIFRRELLKIQNEEMVG